jgi:RNA-binding protein PNO1
MQVQKQREKQDKQKTAAEEEEEQDAGMEDDDVSGVPSFPALSAKDLQVGDKTYVRIAVPPHRYTPVKAAWMELYKPIVEYMKLQVRFNPKKKCIEMRTSEHTETASALQKSIDFIKAFLLGFEVRDAIALLRLDDLYVDSFEVKDVKTLQGEHLSRAIGRIAGQGGKTKFTIENATKTRIVLADTHVHILGSYRNAKIAKDAVVRLIMGSPPGKVYTQMRSVANRMKDRF